MLFPPIAAKEKTTSEAILTATSQTDCSLIPGTAFCEVLEANRPGIGEGKRRNEFVEWHVAWLAE